MLAKRRPELPLGLLAYHNKGKKFTRFSWLCSSYPVRMLIVDHFRRYTKKGKRRK